MAAQLLPMSQSPTSIRRVEMTDGTPGGSEGAPDPDPGRETAGVSRIAADAERALLRARRRGR